MSRVMRTPRNAAATQEATAKAMANGGSGVIVAASRTPVPATSQETVGANSHQPPIRSWPAAVGRSHAAAAISRQPMP
jgi:hypothetical protein